MIIVEALFIPFSFLVPFLAMDISLVLWYYHPLVFPSLCLQVKIIKCLVENIVVDISFDQLGGLCTLCFLEEVRCYTMGASHDVFFLNLFWHYIFLV